MFQNMSQYWNMDEAAKMLQQTFDVEKATEASKKNMESFKEASSIMADTLNSCVERQMQIAQSSMEESIEAMRELSTASGVEELMSKQNFFAKQASETAQKNGKELANIWQKGQEKALNIMTKQVQNNMDSASTVAKKAAAK